MRGLPLVVFLSAYTLMAQPLPHRAKVSVGKRFVGGPVGGDITGCNQMAPPTPQNLRRRLLIYHRISQQDLHDLYDFVDCGVQGTISVDGHAYGWKLYLPTSYKLRTRTASHT